MLFRQQFEAWQKAVPTKQPQALPKMGDWCLGSTCCCLCYPQWLADHSSAFPPLFHTCSGTVFMITVQEADYIAVVCLEGFLYGKISVLCALNCILQVANKVQLFPGLGLYSGIFALYLQCLSKTSRMATIVFYALCLLYFLSTATIVGDFVAFILEVSNNSICRNFIFYHLCSRKSGHYRFNVKLTLSRFFFALVLSKPQQAVVVTSSPNVS